MMYHSCAFVSINCGIHISEIISNKNIYTEKHPRQRSWRDSQHTKNWKPLSVNLGASLSLHKPENEKPRHQIWDTVVIFSYEQKIGRLKDLWLKRPRWKVFIIDELMFDGLSIWDELISCSKKHWYNMKESHKKKCNLNYKTAQSEVSKKVIDARIKT